MELTLSHFRTDTHYWIGLTDAEHESVFRWINYSPLYYEQWSTNEPNGKSSQNCILMINDGKWMDVQCHENHSVLCSSRSDGTAFFISFNFFLKFFCRTHSHVLFWGHWYPCFGFLVTSPLGFKARVGSALFTLRRRM